MTFRFRLVSAVMCVGLGLVGVSAQRATAPAPVRPVASTETRIDRAQVLEDLRALSTDDMEGREIGTSGGARARAYVLSRFKGLGLQTVGGAYEHGFSVPAAGRRPALSGVNVMGVVAGTVHRDRYLVVTAHYDHIGIRNGVVFNGANDNASGTAALFALAHYFRSHPPATSILFVALDGEEPGLLGSRAFVRQPPVPLASMLVNLNPDMIGREPDNRLFVVGAAAQPHLKPFIERVARRAPVRLLMGHEGTDAQEDWTTHSDHYAFREAGVPALYFGVEDFDQQHAPTDDFATITQDFLVRAVETLLMTIEEFDAGADALAAARQANPAAGQPSSGRRAAPFRSLRPSRPPVDR